MGRHQRLMVATAVVGALVLGGAGLAGCGDDAGGGGSSYADVAALDAALEDSGRPCALEYEGLVDEEGTETSQCTIDGQPAILRVYEDPALLDALLETGGEGDGAAPAVAHGSNWAVEVLDVATATALADDLGGTGP